VFGGYRFEHPRTEASVEVGGWGYLWAGLFGAFYVWNKGCRPQFWKALAYNIGYAVLYIGGVGITSMPQVPPLFQAVAIVAGIPAIILLQANTMIGIIKEAYRHRGWMVRLGG
jgi:peptidoglycan/LPS O-acetylase OafA/YrhL